VQHKFFAHSVPVSTKFPTAKPQQFHHLSVTWVNKVKWQCNLLIKKLHYWQKVAIVLLPKLKTSRSAKGTTSLQHKQSDQVNAPMKPPPAHANILDFARAAAREQLKAAQE
jgi:hypothetical protein